jgi:uncharacterized protein with PQ loop repeat
MSKKLMKRKKNENNVFWGTVLVLAIIAFLFSGYLRISRFGTEKVDLANFIYIFFSILIIYVIYLFLRFLLNNEKYKNIK